MALSGTFDAARSGLSVFSQQLGLVARNIGNASDPDASRKLARTTTAGNGEVLLTGVNRSEDHALREALLGAISAGSGERVKVEAARVLQETIGGPGADRSPAALIAALGQSLQVMAAQPSEPSSAGAAMVAARNVASVLNEGARAAQTLREGLDEKIAEAVAGLNGILGRLEGLERRIVSATQAGRDATDDLDRRDKLLGAVAEQIGIRVVQRDMNAVAVYTDSGIALFDTKARPVQFDRSPIVAGVPGGVVSIDGVPATGTSGGMIVRSGAIAGMVAARDEVALRYEAQLDEIARGLVETFSESDQLGTAAPTRPGLFTSAGIAMTPASGLRVAGLAARIEVNATVDTSRGGVWTRLRDGGAADPLDPAYVYNNGFGAGFSGRLRELIGGLAEPRAFAPDAGLGASSGLDAYAASSVGWLAEQRQVATDIFEHKSAVRDRAASALAGVVGISLDQEMADMLEIERSYQASSRLITVADAMLQSLLDAVR